LDRLHVAMVLMSSATVDLLPPSVTSSKYAETSSLDSDYYYYYYYYYYLVQLHHCTKARYAYGPGDNPPTSQTSAAKTN